MAIGLDTGEDLGWTLLERRTPAMMEHPNIVRGLEAVMPLGVPASRRQLTQAGREFAEPVRPPTVRPFSFQQSHPQLDLSDPSPATDTKSY